MASLLETFVYLDDYELMSSNVDVPPPLRAPPTESLSDLIGCDVLMDESETDVCRQTSSSLIPHEG